MSYRERKYQDKVFYNGKEVSVLEKATGSLFVYLKDHVCGWVDESLCITSIVYQGNFGSDDHTKA